MLHDVDAAGDICSLLGGIGEVDRVGQILGVDNVVHEEAAQRLFTILSDRKAMYQLMDGHLVEQRQVFVAITGDMGGLHLVVGEVAKQRACQPPLGVHLRVGGYGAEVIGDSLSERQGGITTVYLRADQFEIDKQALLILNNLGLLRHHIHVCGIAVALVVDKQCKLGRYGLFNLLRQRVVAIDIALHEVSQVKLWRWFHGECDGRECARCFKTCERIDIRQDSAKRILPSNGWCCVLCGDEQNLCHTSSLCFKGPTLIKTWISGKTSQRFRVNLELVTCCHYAFLVSDDQFQLDIGHGRRLAAVEHRERSAESLAG